MGVYKETHDCHHPLHYYSRFFSAFLSLEEGFYKSVEKITQKECNAHALHTKARDSSSFSSLALTHTRSNYLMYYCRCCCCYSFPPSFFCFFLSNPKWTWLLCAPFLLRWLKLQERRRTSQKRQPALWIVAYYRALQSTAVALDFISLFDVFRFILEMIFHENEIDSPYLNAQLQRKSDSKQRFYPPV